MKKNKLENEAPPREEIEKSLTRSFKQLQPVKPEVT